MSTTAAQDAPLVRVSDEGFPLTTDGDFDIAAMPDAMLGDFWIFIEGKRRMMNDLLGSHATATVREIEHRIRERREQNPKAVAIPHRTLTIKMHEEFSKYAFEIDLLDRVEGILAADEFAKIATFVPDHRVTVMLTPERFAHLEPVLRDHTIESCAPHWEIKSTAPATVKSLIDRYDGTPEGDLLKEFMHRDRTGERVIVEYRKGASKNITPERAS